FLVKSKVTQHCFIPAIELFGKTKIGKTYAKASHEKSMRENLII
ncbi:MAG: hypothetical protein ACI9XB_002224, partial [Gammaproteobacteria bacterium]